MAIAMQAQRTHRADRVETRTQLVGNRVDALAIANAQAFTKQVRIKHGQRRCLHKSFHVDATTFVKYVARTNSMDTCQQSSHPRELLGRIQFRRTTAATRIQRITKSAMLKQAVAVFDQRRNHR